MSINTVFDIAGMGMSAQTVRLNTVASNLANVETAASSAEAAYHARRPVFKATAMQSAFGDANNSQSDFGVMIADIIESQAPVEQRYQPQHPMANEEGYVFYSNVNTVEEMADMISASRSFQLNIEMMNTAKSMAQRLLTLGQ